MASVRIWQKKKLHLDPLTFRQRDMVQVGSAGLLSVFKRLSSAQGPNDGPAKPLCSSYQRYKTRRHMPGVRNLRLTGDMLRNLTLRTVTDNSAKAALTSRKEIDKGRGNTKREPWLVFSPQNRAAVIEKAKQIFREATARIIRST
jgi:hypothetical protein